MLCSLILTLSASNMVFAKTQSAQNTYSGHIVTSSLECNFELFGFDKGTAKTNWDGMKGYGVEARIYYRPNLASDYIRLDKDYGDRGALVIGSKKGVWDFKSNHYVKNNKKSKTQKILTLTDW